MPNSIFKFTETDKIEFLQKNFVLTGFGAQDEKYLTKAILSRGGMVRSSLVLATDYLIVNEYFDHESVKYKKAIELNAAGKNIVIISKAKFDELSKQTAVTNALEEKTEEDKTPVAKPAKKEIRKLSVIPTGSGNIEFDKVSFALLGITGADKAQLTGIIEAKGGVVGNPGKKTQYLIYNPDKASGMKFWETAVQREAEDTIYLMTPELFYLWTNEKYEFENLTFDKQLNGITHYLQHTDDYLPDQYGLKEKIEKVMLSKACEIIDKLSGSDNTGVLQLYLDWGHNQPERKWFSEIKPDKISKRGMISIVKDFLIETEQWNAAKQKDKDAIETYIIENRKRILDAYFENKDINALRLTFDYISEKEKQWTEIGYSDGYYVYTLVNKYTEKAIEKRDTDIISYLLDYKASRYDELFIEEADSNELDIEFGLKEKPAVYYSKGEEIILGKYNDKPIEWIVLKQEDDRALVISKYALLNKAYNDRYKNIITWEKCTLRKWLNDDFYKESFNEEEKEKILKVRIENADNMRYKTPGGNDTEDNIFLLSIDEAKNLFSDDESRECQMLDGSSWWWWLRSPGSRGNNAANVSNDGSLNEYGTGVIDVDGAVRPALWLRLSNL